MTRSRVLLVTIVCIAHFLIACQKHETSPSTLVHPQKTLSGNLPDNVPKITESALGKLLGEPFKVATENHQADSSNVVVLIGENHASVAAQMQLATVLERLHEAQRVDAVLVEGSNGALPVADFVTTVNAAANDSSLQDFWKRQLEWGDIAGYEYFLLLHPSVPAVGVEDMSAKRNYEITSLADQTAYTSRVDALGLASERLASAAKEIIQLGGDDSEVLREVAKLRDAKTQLAASVQTMMPVLQDYARETGGMLRKQAQLNALFEKLRGPIAEYNSLVEQIQGTEEERLPSLDSLTQQAQAFRTAHAAEISRLEALGEELQGFQPRHESLQAQIESLMQAVSEQEQIGHDAFFRGANRLRRAASKVPAKLAQVESARRAVESVDRFFIDEAQRAEAVSLQDAKRALSERDAAMATNVASYFAAASGKTAVVVVGYAHLRGMEEQLANRNLNFVSGGLIGNANDEYWNVEAWHKRREAVPKVFSTLKEVSRFLDSQWKKEMSGLVAWSRTLDPTVTSRASLESGDEHIVHVGKYLADQRTVLGEQVTLRGPAGPSGVVFEVWDRNKGRTLVKDLTNQSALFAYAFQNKSNSQYRVFTRAGEQSLQKFMEAAPNSKYVVLFHEPDVVEESGVPVSELWASLRPAGGGGHGGAPPPKGPWYQAGFADGGGDGRGFRPGLLRTNHPRRAAVNVAKLERQKPLDAAEITVLDEISSLGKIPFTPSDGEAAGLVVLIARNEAEFRDGLRRAGEARKLENKQVALITCGDAFRESMALRERLLASGAVIVWMPNRQISEVAGKRLALKLEQIREEAVGKNIRFRDIDALMNHAVGELISEEPVNVDLMPLTHSGSFVRVSPVVSWSEAVASSAIIVTTTG